MTAWERFLARVSEVITNLRDDGCPDPFFRGHADSHWQLVPSLGRVMPHPAFHEGTEARLYYDFSSLGGHLIPTGASTWDTLFLLQHHGLPTRLLDWTTTFSVALYFATQQPAEKAALWILDPYELNAASLKSPRIQFLNTSFEEGYEHWFLHVIDDEEHDESGDDDDDPIDEEFPAAILAIGGDSRSARMRSQRAVFTLHRELEKPLEQVFSDCVKKVMLPRAALEDAKDFLALAGVNEYSVFPDLDGLSRYLKIQELPT